MAVMAQACDSSTWEMEAEVSQVRSHPVLHRKTMFKKEKRWKVDKYTNNLNTKNDHKSHESKAGREVTALVAVELRTGSLLFSLSFF